MERRAVKRARAIVVVLIIAIVAGGAGLWRMRHRPVSPITAATHSTARTTDAAAPAGQRIRVQVLNGTKTRGLARRATLVLRDHGFDVVETGTDTIPRDTTIVYALSGHPEWAATVAKLFDPARVVTRADSSRYLDISISIGSTWRAPAQPFYP